MLNRRRFSDKAVIATFLMLLLLLIAVLTFWLVYPKITSALESLDEKKETRECLQWEKWSKEAKGVFYLTTWQKEQCDAMGIKIDAPVIGKGE